MKKSFKVSADQLARSQELSISTEYVNWTIQDGIRELMQNAIDGQARGHELSVNYYTGTDELYIGSKRARLPMKALLLGFSTKRGDMDAVGQWGEGLKLGCLALIRNGLKVKITNGKQIWIPELRVSDAYKEEVLVFDIYETGRDQDLEFMIEGLGADQWSECQERFLMFEKPGSFKEYTTPVGRVLDGPGMAGKIYTNGILVEKIEDEAFEFGYDFNPKQIRVDRDRRMISRHELKCQSSKMWVSLAGNKEEHFERIENMLRKNTPDVQQLEWTWNVDANLKERLYKSFVKDFGPNAVPVLSQEDVNEANFMGRHAYKYGEAYVKIIQEHTGDLEKIRKEYATVVNKEFDSEDLLPNETSNLLGAMQMLSDAVGGGVPPIKIVEFHKEDLLGLHRQQNSGADILISRKSLKSLASTVRVLIHEYSHENGGDGEPSHVATMEETWTKVLEKTLEKSKKRLQDSVSGS